MGEAAYSLIETLNDHGFDAYWVGGAVREMLEEILPKDIDIATSATPDEMRHIFKGSTTANEEMGSIRVRRKRHTFEITTFRKEGDASDGRTPDAVEFTKDLKEDALRRDFTINAIYWNPVTSRLEDPCDGQADMKEQLVRFIGTPSVRIKHDVLRILRAVRLRASIDGQYHPETYVALKQHAANTLRLSGTRIMSELKKLLMGRNTDCGLRDLMELRILEAILPELDACRGIPQPKEYHKEGDVWEHTLQCAKSFREEDTCDARLAALFHDCGKAKTFSLKERIRFDHHATVSAELARSAMKRLQCSGEEIEKIDWLIRHHMMMGSFLDMEKKRKAHWYFHPWFKELLSVFYLDIAGTNPADYSLYTKIIQDYDHFLDSLPRPPKRLLTGDDVMHLLGISAGERIGQILSELHGAQVRKEVQTKDEAIAFVEKLRGSDEASLTRTFSQQEYPK